MNKLHFGCFNCPVGGWINTDITPHIYVARVPGLAWLIHFFGKMDEARYKEHQSSIFNKVSYLDVAKKWHFEDCSLDAIYSSHVLEHLTLSGARKCVAESYRCLSQGGVFRLVLPDLDLLVEEFDKNRSMAWAIKFFEADQNGEKNMHHFMYNFNSLQRILLEAGFTKINRVKYRVGACPDIDVLDNRPDSLFVEAIK